MTTHSPESNYTATKPTSLWHKCTCARCVHVWAVVIETVIVAGISKCLYFFSPSQSLPSLATPRLLTQIIVCRLVQGAKKCGRVGWQGRAHACVCSTLFYYSLHHDHHPCNTHLPPLRLALLRPRSQSRRPSSVVRRPVVSAISCFIVVYMLQLSDICIEIAFVFFPFALSCSRKLLSYTTKLRNESYHGECIL